MSTLAAKLLSGREYCPNPTRKLSVQMQSAISILQTLDAPLKRYLYKIVHFSARFSQCFCSAIRTMHHRPFARRRQWTFVRPLPIMKKINHLGETNRVPLDLKSTINLPKTDFPMKANLPQNEPKVLARWEQMRIYDRIREARQGRHAMSSTTVRPTPTGPSIWATRSTNA